MRIVRAIVLIPLTNFFWLTGCYDKNVGTSSNSAAGVTEYPVWQAARTDWHDLTIGKSNAVDVAAVFKTPVTAEDRYAYALDEEKQTGNLFLMMVNLDEDSIVTSKYYWEWVSTSISPLVRVETWEMAMETHIPASVLQEYTATPGPREEAILEYFGRMLYEISVHYEHLDQVFEATGSMKRIYTLAAARYNMQADKQALLVGERGFVFDAEIFGKKCTMSLTPIDERTGWYFLLLKGHRTQNFFTN